MTAAAALEDPDTMNDRHQLNQEGSSAFALIRSLLITAAVVCVVGIGATAAARLLAVPGPKPAFAAPLQVQSMPVATPPVLWGSETTLPAPAQSVAVVAPQEPAKQDDAEMRDVPQPAELALAEYSVVKGDTLAAIGSAHGLSVSELLAVNDLADADLLHIGQTIFIPRSASSTTPITTTAPKSPTDSLTPIEPTPAAPADESRWIDVDLSEQRLTAYEQNTPVRTTLVSTGLPQTPTPVGEFRVWIKLRYDDMAGPGYYIADVPFVMYFHEGYGLHGVTWHGNFGHPMSHGCVNLPTAEAEWLFSWAEVGTLVSIHS